MACSQGNPSGAVTLPVLPPGCCSNGSFLPKMPRSPLNFFILKLKTHKSCENSTEMSRAPIIPRPTMVVERVIGVNHQNQEVTVRTTQPDRHLTGFCKHSFFFQMSLCLGCYAVLLCMQKTSVLRVQPPRTVASPSLGSSPVSLGDLSSPFSDSQLLESVQPSDGEHGS